MIRWLRKPTHEVNKPLGQFFLDESAIEGSKVLGNAVLGVTAQSDYVVSALIY